LSLELTRPTTHSPIGYAITILEGNLLLKKCHFFTWFVVHPPNQGKEGKKPKKSLLTKEFF
jgi:hypothetical protein